ncbi:IS110 family transposase [Synergistales bacterium]|nr:IS110 family transposase [Synergistales bacterium]
MSVMFYLGVDVSKKTLSVYLKDTRKDNAVWTNKSVSNDEKGFAVIADTVIKKISKVCTEPFTVAIGMESTGVYGERLAYYFQEHMSENFTVYVLNPMAVHSFAKSSMTKNKNDAVDAQVIASYMSMAIPGKIVSPWIAPSEDEVILNALSKRREELVGMRTEEQNRLEKQENKANSSDDVVGSVQRSIEYLDDEITRIEKGIRDHVDKNPGMKNDLDLMRSIPGIGDVTSVVIESETGGLSNFSSARQLTAYVGLSPVEHTSGTSVYKRSHISKRGNARIRHVLYMCAMVAVRVNPMIRSFYERLVARGKSKKLAIVACMRKLLHILWSVIKHNRKFDPAYAK